MVVPLIAAERTQPGCDLGREEFTCPYLPRACYERGLEGGRSRAG